MVGRLLSTVVCLPFNTAAHFVPTRPTGSAVHRKQETPVTSGVVAGHAEDVRHDSGRAD